MDIENPHYYGYIYKITNIINNKIYIGKHKIQNNKIDENYWGSGLYIKNAINYYGLNNFTREIVCRCKSLDELNEREVYYIALFNSTNSELGYNIKKGGEGGFPEVYAGEKNGMYGVHRFGEDNPNYGNHWSEESRLKMSKSIKERGGRQGEKNPMYGKKHSEESRTKMREAAKHRPPVSQETRDKQSKSRKGKKHSEATKLKMSQNNAMKNPIYREKVPQALRGKPGKAKGKIWVRNTKCTKMINKEDLNIYLNNGYTRGRK